MPPININAEELTKTTRGSTQAPTASAMEASETAGWPRDRPILDPDGCGGPQVNGLMTSGLPGAAVRRGWRV